MDIRFVRYYFVCIVTLLILCIKETKGAGCKKVNSCKCEQDDGKVIDLSPLAKKGKASFQDVLDVQGQDSFSWNPCKSFSEGDCKDVAVCQIRTPPGSAPLYFNAGTQDSAQFIYDDTQGILALQYQADTVDDEYGDPNEVRLSLIDLVCDESQEKNFVPTGEVGTSTYFMTLKSKYACPRKPSLSAGTILIIIFFSLLFVYLVGGIAFQIFIRKESGRRIFPNSDFWISLPNLIKDGVFFVLRFGKGKGSYSGLIIFVHIVDIFGQSYIPQKCDIFKRVPCVCQDEYGNYVDLRPLAMINDNPKFLNVEEHNSEMTDRNFLFSWNPCYGFSEGNDMCSDVAVCRIAYDLKYYEDIGRQDTAYFSHFDNGNLSLVYTSKDNSSTTIVSLYCDDKEEARFRVNGALDSNGYWLQLWSKYNCPRKPLTDEDTVPETEETDLNFNCLTVFILLTSALISMALFTIFVSRILRSKREVGKVRYMMLQNHDDGI